MAFREVRVHEVREVLRHWLADEVGLRRIAERAGVDRKTARRYVEAAVKHPGFGGDPVLPQIPVI